MRMLWLKCKPAAVLRAPTVCHGSAAQSWKRAEFTKCSRCCAQSVMARCASQAFITHSADIRNILDHIGVEPQAPHIASARGPPLWDDFDAQKDDGVQVEPNWGMAAQPAPDYEVDQRVNW